MSAPQPQPPAEVGEDAQAIIDRMLWAALGNERYPRKELNRASIEVVAEFIRSQAEKLASVERERDEARSIVRDIYWMACRYADGRKSYAVGMFNDAIRKAYDAGWLTFTRRSDELDPQYARDGSKPEWVGIEDTASSYRARIAVLEKALEVFANAATWHEQIQGKDADDGLEVLTRLGHLRSARAAIASPSPGADSEPTSPKEQIE